MIFNQKNSPKLINSLNSIILLLILWYYMTLCSDINAPKKREEINMKVTGLILARCGSKGIKMKNIAKINGKSLLQRTINVMVQFGGFDDIWVSTDCQEIADEVERFGAQVHWRDKATATDNAPSILAVKEFLQKHDGIGAIGLLQCTSPFIKVDFLNEAFDKLIREGYDSVFSVTRQYKLFWSMRRDGTADPENFDVEKRPRRQDWNGQLVETGMFYFFRTSLIADNVLQGGRIGYVEIPANHSLEIDTEFDLKVAEAVSRILEG